MLYRVDLLMSALMYLKTHLYENIDNMIWELLVVLMMGVIFYVYVDDVHDIYSYISCIWMLIGMDVHESYVYV